VPYRHGKGALQLWDVIARLDRATQYSRADRDALEYWATRSSRVVTVAFHSIFLSHDFISVLIAFPYRSMGLLY
jgi:hypothetical protein